MSASEKNHGLEARAERDLKRILKLARAMPELRKRGPKLGWRVGISILSAAKMSRLNRAYRGKSRPTDVLSFPAPPAFKRLGVLGELVICAPVLRRQAKELQHAPELELDVLIIHGLLHLLGFDHERGQSAARRMAKLEMELLGRLLRRRLRPGSLGLIARTHSGITQA